MERVQGMPIRVVCIKKIEDKRLKRSIQPGEILDLGETDFKTLSQMFPGCIQEIEMTQEDWVDLATKNAFDCKRRIAILEAMSRTKFSSYYVGVIPDCEGQKVTGSGYGGGLPDAYRKTLYLKDDVDSFENKLLESNKDTQDIGR